MNNQQTSGLENEIWRAQVKSAINCLLAMGDHFSLQPEERAFRQTSSHKHQALVRTLRPHIPYCVHPDGEGHHILVNRDYTPLGISTTECVDYSLAIWPRIPDDHPFLQQDDTYFFGDGSAPWLSMENLVELGERLQAFLNAYPRKTAKKAPPRDD